jgi:hypothetical protein
MPSTDFKHECSKYSLRLDINANQFELIQFMNKDDAYAFIFDQQGLMASFSIEGTKISRIKK